MTLIENLLTTLAEEGVEVALEISKFASKANRFGHEDRPPEQYADQRTNAEKIVDELNDLIAIADMLSNLGVIPTHWQSAEKQAVKTEKVRKFLNYSVDRGRLDCLDTKSTCTHGVNHRYSCPICDQ